MSNLTDNHTMTHYVAGFMFSPNFENVVLIEKNKPEWQRGKYNAIGGKIENEETAEQAMVREFEEETSINQKDWEHFVSIEGPDYKVHFFYTVSTKWAEHLSVTDEEVFNIPVRDLHTVRHFLIENLNWLIPMAIDAATGFSGKITLP